MRTRILMFIAVIAALVPFAALAAGAKGSLHATMTGRAETPRGDLDGRGTAEIKITGRRVCWELKVSRIATPNAAHIHKGGVGVAGPVVVPLGGKYKAKGCTTTSAATARALQMKPRSFYVNVHNAKYPNGAVRGQLHS
jgi:CHRD domain